MKINFSKTILLGAALAMCAPAMAQEAKVKIERPGYELKVKQEKDEFKYKESGSMRMGSETMTEPRTTTTVKKGETMTVVKTAYIPENKTAAAPKKCDCPAKKTTAAHKPAAKRPTTAYKAKAKPAVRTVVKTVVKEVPVVVHDSVFVTRVDTVISMIEPAYFTGYRQDRTQLVDNFKKLKIEREKDGEVTIKKEYFDGREEKMKFSEEEFNTYMEWKNF